MNHARAEFLDDAFEVWIEARERVSVALRSCYEARGDEEIARARAEVDRARAAEARAESLFYSVRDTVIPLPAVSDGAVH